MWFLNITWQIHAEFVILNNNIKYVKIGNYIILIYQTRGKNDFAEVPKNLIGYRSENNFNKLLK